MSYIDNYNYWKNHNNLDPTLRKELESMSEKEIEDAFYTDVKFQTAGMRGVMGVGSNRINIHTIRKATLGFANYLNKNNKHKIAIGYDNRFNSKEFAFDCAKLLASNGIKVYVFESLRPTPELSFAVRYKKCDGGIMITASHNPKQYNGYKLYDETGCQLVPTLAEAVINEIDQLDDILSISPKEYDESLIEIIGEEVDNAYWQNVLSIQLRKNLNKDFKIAFSPEHGTSNIPVRKCLKEAGYDIYVVPCQENPDPAFSNTKSPNPEESLAYEGVLNLAKDIDAELILVCDPDGDRMGVGVKHNGEYKILNGNQTGAILIEYIMSSLNELKMMPENPCIFNTIVTSDIGKECAKFHGVDCEQSLTGFKYIGDKVRKYETNHLKNYVFGYEESYGSLISPFVRDKDATQACLMFSEACAYYREKNKTLVDVLDDIYHNIGAYYDSQISIMLPGSDGSKKLQEIMSFLREKPLEIPGYETVKVEDYKLQIIKDKNGTYSLIGHDVSDVLKYFFNDGSFIAIRPSGTEPKCKFYLSCKDETYEKAQKKDEFFTSFLKDLIK